MPRRGTPGEAHDTPPEEATAPLVVVSPAAPLDELGALYRLCARALNLAVREGRHRRRDRRGMRELTDFAAEIATADQPLLGAHMRDRLLGGLDPSDGFHRQLALTALTFLETAGGWTRPRRPCSPTPTPFATG